MSEIINNSTQRKQQLRELLLRLHNGESPEIIRVKLIEALRNIPYGEVVEVEQELINSNALTEAEILEFCDLHTAVLDGSIDLEGAQDIPAGHPVDTFKKENQALKAEVDKYNKLKTDLLNAEEKQLPAFIIQFRTIFNNFADVDKHYKRKEYLLFPFLEKHLITGPPKVMWGKHDETRNLLKKSFEALEFNITSIKDLQTAVSTSLNHTVEMIDGMIIKEEDR